VEYIAGLRIERGKRFIHQQHTGLRGQGASNGHPLPHASGELMDVTVAKLS
jgi:hypothetical protein